MSWERAGRLAWAAPLIAAGSIAAFVVLMPERDRDGTEWAFGLAFVAYAVVGALIVSRHPRNPVGWLFCLIGSSSAGHEALYAYAARPGRAPGEEAAAWLASWMTEPSTAAIVLLLLAVPERPLPVAALAQGRLDRRGGRGGLGGRARPRPGAAAEHRRRSPTRSGSTRSRACSEPS